MSPIESTTYSRWVNGFPVYYGWVVLGVGTLGMLMTTPAQSYVLAVFMDSYIHDLGISRSLISSLFTLGTLAGSLAMPAVGRLIDRKGARLVLTAISACFGLSLVYMAAVSNAWMLLIGFVAYRLFGKAALYLVSTNAINPRMKVAMSAPGSSMMPTTAVIVAGIASATVPSKNPAASTK